MTAGPESPLVYLVDDDEAFRDSLRWLLDAAGYRVAAFSGAELFLASFQPGAGACLILDVRMPGYSGLELQKEMARRGHAIPIIFVTGHGDVPMAVNAVKNGAFDFIEKPFKDQALLTLIENAANLNVSALQDEAERLSAIARLATLTQREREVMELVVAGKRNKQIADDLGISVKTVEVHRARVMEKTGVASVAELVQMTLSAKTSS